jgi:hypothetical protein
MRVYKSKRLSFFSINMPGSDSGSRGSYDPEDDDGMSEKSYDPEDDDGMSEKSYDPEDDNGMSEKSYDPEDDDGMSEKSYDPEDDDGMSEKSYDPEDDDGMSEKSHDPEDDDGMSEKSHDPYASKNGGDASTEVSENTDQFKRHITDVEGYCCVNNSDIQCLMDVVECMAGRTREGAAKVDLLEKQVNNVEKLGNGLLSDVTLMAFAMIEKLEDARDDRKTVRYTASQLQLTTEWVDELSVHTRVLTIKISALESRFRKLLCLVRNLVCFVIFLLFAMVALVAIFMLPRSSKLVLVM